MKYTAKFILSALCRKFSVFIVCIASGVFLLIAPACAGDPDPEWQWGYITQEMSPDLHWETMYGIATLNLDDTHLRGIIGHQSKDVLTLYNIDGEVHGDVVKAKVYQLYTSENPRTYSGYIKRLRDHGLSWGIDTVILVDKSMGSVIILTRKVPFDK